MKNKISLAMMLAVALAASTKSLSAHHLDWKRGESPQFWFLAANQNKERPHLLNKSSSFKKDLNKDNLNFSL